MFGTILGNYANLIMNIDCMLNAYYIFCNRRCNEIL